MGRKQPYRVRVKDEWAKSLLQAQTLENKTVYDRLQEARAEWESALSEARTTLGLNPLAPAVAATVAREANKRGEATLQIDNEGQMYLEVQYKGTPEAGEKRKWVSNLQSLEVLRQKATDMGIDPSQYGRSKTRLLAAIEAISKTPKPKMKKTAPAIGPLTIIKPDNSETLN